MKKGVFIFLIFYTFNVLSQNELRSNPYIDSTIIFKNGDTINGVVKLNDSAFDLRFKDSLKQKKRRKIKFKEVEKIIAYGTSLYPREFHYKKTDQSKFFHFVELIHPDTISLYVSSSDNLGLFYCSFDPNIRSSGKMIYDMQNKNNPTSKTTPINKEFLFFDRYGYFIKNLDYHTRSNRIDYFLQKKNQEKLTLIGSKGNFLYKNFKKTAAKYFEGCSTLIEKIQSKELKLKHLPDIIEYYKSQCN